MHFVDSRTFKFFIKINILSLVVKNLVEKLN